jgi:hypothetical protein
MLAVIDGTGEWSNDAYNKSMKNSFLNQIISESNIYPKKYFRGPSVLGLESAPIVVEVLNWIRQNLNNGYPPVLYLAGYSRGGAIAIDIANEIKSLVKYRFDVFNSKWRDLNANIKCLALFDAVSRTYLDTDIIPDNVKYACHAVRNSVTGSRRSFSNTGLQHQIAGNLEPLKYFDCTHAAMGGVPWTGDHPTKTTGYKVVIPITDTTIEFKSSSLCITQNVSSCVLDIVRDEMGFSLSEMTSTPTFKLLKNPLISEITVPTTSKEKDMKVSADVRSFMWDCMRKKGMFGYSDADLHYFA